MPVLGRPQGRARRGSVRARAASFCSSPAVSSRERRAGSTGSGGDAGALVCGAWTMLAVTLQFSSGVKQRYSIFRQKL